MDTLFSSLADAFANLWNVFSAAFDVWFIIFPPLFFFLFKILWKLHVEDKFGAKLKWVLLELIPPRDIEKSPLPMESIFAGFAGVIKTATAAEVWIKGEFPTAFSLEIASTEGNVHMYVRTHAGFRHLIEANFYAQYPNIEIVEVPDYVHTVPITVPNKDWELWGCDFGLAKDDLYPIRTYKYFEESVTGKMIDPLGGVIETMGKIGPGQHMWIQWIITPIKETWYDIGATTVDEFLGKVEEKKLGVFGRVFHDLLDVFKNIGGGLLAREVTFTSPEEKEEKEEAPVEFRLTPGEKEVLKALQANLAKQMFRTRMRYVYIARNEVFDKPTGVSAFIGSIKQFNDFNLNSFSVDDLSKTYADYLFTKERLRYRQRRLLRRYIKRDSDPQNTRFLLSTEELATVFHIPDMAVIAPTMVRVAAKHGGAPVNLPIQE
ncbi:MAG: hypothetical protein Q7S04_03300 [Candidatus Moranbacteria bacterium]|nr:hypothetical protein [Candidatus Moranbacteria bacterium]